MCFDKYAVCKKETDVRHGLSDNSYASVLNLAYFFLVLCSTEGLTSTLCCKLATITENANVDLWCAVNFWSLPTYSHHGIEAEHQMRWLFLLVWIN